MNDKPESQDSNTESLKQLARKTLESSDQTTEIEVTPELAFFRIPTIREKLIVKGTFTPEEIKILDQLAEKHANLKAEQTAKETKRRFADGLNLSDQTSESESND